MNTQKFVRCDDDVHDGRGPRLYTCRNQLCDRLTTAMFCCVACSMSAGKYEVDDTGEGPLSHSEQCNERHERRSAAT